MRVAVVGHVEWIEFARVERVPLAGEIVHALEAWEEPGGGGAVAAVQLAKLAGERPVSDRARRRRGRAPRQGRARAPRRARGGRLAARAPAAGVRLCGLRGRADDHRDRRAARPEGVRPAALARARADGRGLLHGRRRGRRACRALGPHACRDRARNRGPGRGAAFGWTRSCRAPRTAGERYAPGDLDPPPLLVARTAGPAGGAFETADGRSGRWPPAPAPAPLADAYGAGDCFAAGLTFGLGEGRSIDDALELGSRCGAACMTGRGPYAGQLRSPG